MRGAGAYMSDQERFVIVTEVSNAERWRELAREIAMTGFVEGNFQRIAAGTAQRIFGPVSFNRKVRGSGICPGIALDLMIQCFQEGEEVPFADLEELFSRPTSTFMEEIRLVDRVGAACRANVSLTPWRGILVAADPPSRVDSADYVGPPKDPATSLVDSFVRPLPPRARVVDLGTGSGLLAVLLQLQGADVTGIDPNPVALKYLTLNSLLNGASPICRSQVGDHRILSRTAGWDQILFNMPATYAASRRPAYGFAEANRGLEVVREFYRPLPASLATRGMAGTRHDMKVSCLSREAFLDEIRQPNDLQIAYVHEDESVHRKRCARPPNPDPDFPRASPEWVLGGALIRRLKLPGPSQVDFLPFREEEIRHYSPRRFWRRLLALEGWKDALMSGI